LRSHAKASATMTEKLVRSAAMRAGLPDLPPRDGSLEALLRIDFHAHGAGVIEVVRRKHPTTYLRLVADMLPRELSLSAIEIGNIGDEELVKIIQDLRAGRRHPAPSGRRAKPPKG
jgi:hypothetical protein